jgi:hypothetical protein
VASFTPAIAGMSGTWVGASGETVDDMEANPECHEEKQIVMARSWPSTPSLA